MSANSLSESPAPARSEPARDPSAPIAVRVASDGAAWDRCVRGTESGSFYHLYAWSEINRAELGHESIYLEAVAGGAVIGILPLVLVKSRLFGRILCSMPFVNFGGPCTADASVATALVDAAIARANELRVDYLELRSTSELSASLPASLHKVSMTLDLQADPDVLWNAFSSKHRNTVRRAYKNDLQVRSGGVELLPVFYSVMEQSWRALGTPLYAKSYFRSVLETFGERARLFVCHRNEEPIAVAFNGEENGVVEGLWAGTRGAARELGANYVLYWEMIRDACVRGCRQFHLGRSTTDSGGEEFKKKWNATSKQLYWYYHRPDGGPLPRLNVDNPKYRLAIAAWQRLPLPVTRVIGPPIARLIP